MEPLSLPAGSMYSEIYNRLQPWCCRVLANVLFPNWLITMMLLGLLIFLTYKTGKKALSLHRCEVRYLAQAGGEHSQALSRAGWAGSEKWKGPERG